MAEATDVTEPVAPKEHPADRYSAVMARRLSPLGWKRFVPAEPPQKAEAQTEAASILPTDVQNKCFAILGYLEEYYRPASFNSTQPEDIDLTQEAVSAQGIDTPRQKSGLEQLEDLADSVLSAPQTAGERLTAERQEELDGQHRKQVEEKLTNLLAIPEVRQKFEEEFNKELPLYQAARGTMKQVRDLNRVTGKLRRAIYKKYLGDKQQYGKLTQSSVDLIYSFQDKLESLEGQEKGLEKTATAATSGYLETQKLLDYKRQLKEKGFVVTPSREHLIDRITREALAGKKIFLVGSTGTGKTQLAFYALNNLTGGYELINWHEGTTPRDLFGYRELWTDELGGVQSGMKPGPIPKALEAGVGAIHEEYTGGSTRTQLAAKFMLGARPGNKIQIPGFNGQIFDVTNNFIEIFTGNPKDERTKQREEMDPAILRELTGVEVSYMSAGEMYDIIRAGLIEESGVLKLSPAETEYIKQLTKAAEMMQRVHNRDFNGFTAEMKTLLGIDAQGNTDTTLNANFLDPGTLFKLFGEWELASARGQKFSDYIKDKLHEFIADPKTLSHPEERKIIQKILKAFNLISSPSGQFEVSISSGGGGKGYILPSEMAGGTVLSNDNPMADGSKPEDRQPSAVEARAKEILGKDFLGVEAVRAMEQKLRAAGKNVEFKLENVPPIPYSERDLEIAKENGEMLVLRAQELSVDGLATAGVNIVNFRELFRDDPLGKLDTTFYSFRPDANDWYETQDFATGKDPGQIKLGWALVKKDVIQGSTSKTWDDQKDILAQYSEGLKQKGATSTTVKRRTATEAVWDEMLYYINTGEQLLPDKYDWTISQTSDGHLVYVGRFASKGLHVYRHPRSLALGLIGVCSSR